MAGRQRDVWPVLADIRLRLEAERPQAAISGISFHFWGDGPDNPAAEFFRSHDGFLARFPGIADFHVSADGQDVVCVPATDNAAAWRATYAQQIVALALSLQGEAVYHGGAVVAQDGAVAFLGRSGQGKSTLVAACAARGHAFLSDDCLILREEPLRGESMTDGTRVSAVPHADFIRLWPDSAQGYAAQPGQALTYPGSPKPRLQADPDALPYCGVATCIQRAFVLADPVDDGVRVTRLSPSQAAMAWTANGFVMDMKSPQTLRRNLARAGRLATAIPVYKLEYPRRYEVLDAVVRQVVEWPQ